MNITTKPDLTKLATHTNPFTYSLEIKVRELKNTNAFILDGEEFLHQTFTVETSPKISVYVKSEHRLISNSLPTSSKELLLWIFYTVESNVDYLWLNKYRYMKECDVALNTYKKGIEGLIRYGFLQGTVVKDTYWINPEFFFKGDRKNKYLNNVKLEK